MIQFFFPVFPSLLSSPLLSAPLVSLLSLLPSSLLSHLSRPPFLLSPLLFPPSSLLSPLLSRLSPLLSRIAPVCSPLSLLCSALSSASVFARSGSTCYVTALYICLVKAISWKTAVAEKAQKHGATWSQNKP